MIKSTLKPQERFIKFIEKSKEHPKLRVEIKIYNEPVASTKGVSIFSTVEILEEDDDLFGVRLFGTILTETEVEDLFKDIIAHPMTYKTSSKTYENK